MCIIDNKNHIPSAPFPLLHAIYPCLWFDGQAQSAAEFYCSAFGNSKITSDSAIAVQFEIEGTKIMGLNGGPMFKINPSISFFVSCVDEDEITRLWGRLSDGGQTMMALGTYPWSEKYGWVADRFGMTWQLMLGELLPDAKKIIPLFLFVGDQFGNASQAISHYSTIFQNSAGQYLELYKDGEVPGADGSLKFGNFSLDGNQFAAMDGPGNHNFRFNEGVSLVVECDTQEEIDFFWETLIMDGGAESQCGWLQDKYGVSWQIIPASLGSLMSDPERGQRAMQQLLKMKKLDINILKNA